MAEHYQIAVVGSGPGGMSAAGRAAQRGVSHVLLEKADHASDTIYKYQKGKLVMATPDVLPLRSDFSFELGIREDILGTWDDELGSNNVNMRYDAEVTGITGERGNFEITLAGGETLTADAVVMGIGLQGNLRKVEVPGAAEASFIQYQLDDPDEYEAETIVVIGAGDAAIENAVALARQNTVIIVNRRDEFARAKDGNVSLITDAIDKGLLSCMYSASPTSVDPAGSITMGTPEGDVEDVLEEEHRAALRGADERVDRARNVGDVGGVERGTDGEELDVRLVGEPKGPGHVECLCIDTDR